MDARRLAPSPGSFRGSPRTYSGSRLRRSQEAGPSWAVRLFLFQGTWFLLGCLLFGVVEIGLYASHPALQGSPFRGIKSPQSTRAGAMAGIRPHFVLFGDSITQQSFNAGGWGAMLASQYARKADVVLRGYSGYNTRWAAFLMDKLFPRSGPPPTLVTIFFGANDAALATGTSSRQHVPILEYKSNLHQMVAHIREMYKLVHVVLITPPPVDEAGRLQFARQKYGEQATPIAERQNAVTLLYAEACKEAGKELGVPVIDLWTSIQDVADWEHRCLSDGLHLTPDGNRVLFEQLAEVLSKSWPHLVWDALPQDFPDHSEIDPAAPSRSFLSA